MLIENLPGHGAKERPEHLKVKDRVAGAILPFDWSQIKEDPIGNVPGLFGITDQDQGSSLTCTVQVTRYGLKYTIKYDKSVENTYCHVYLPGGGAYLNAPLDYIRHNGVVPQSKYPDANPQTESAMEKILVIQQGDVYKAFSLTYTLYPDTANIDSAAYAITQHDYIHLGIRMSFTNGWNGSWVDPAYNGQNDDQHALFAGKESIVIRHGAKAIKAKSSWCEHKDFIGEQVFCHYLTDHYFISEGVFEIIGVDIKELNVQLTTSADGKTFFIEGDKGKIGIADPDSLALIQSITSEQPAQTNVSIPEVETLSKGFIINKK